jgi:TP901 family phage tail tape measure protein
MADEVVLRFRGDSTEVVKAAKAAADAVRGFGVQVRQTSKDVDRSVDLSKQLGQMGTGLKTVGTTLTASVTLPIAAAFGMATKAAMSFETAFANVKKTVGRDDPTLPALAKTLRALAQEIPQSVEALSHIAALGGQFGIAGKDLAGFTRTIADLGVAVDGISTEQAATGLAQLRNVTGETTAEISNMAATLVELGNKGASTEGQILDFAQRIAGSAKMIGLSTPEIMGLGAALANVGLNAEAGGTAMSRTISQMSVAVDSGGEKLAAFARIAQMSGEEFARTFREKPIDAINAFIVGLGNAKSAGENLTLLLGDIGIEGVRQMDTLKRAALSADQLTNTIKLAGAAWVQNTAHTEEARAKYETTANQLKLFWQRLNEIGILMGGPIIKSLNMMLQSLDPVIDALKSMAEQFTRLPGGVQATFFGAFGLLAVAGPVAFLAGQLALSAKALIDVKRAMDGVRAAQLAGDVSLLGGALTKLPLVGVIGLVIGLAAAVRGLTKDWGEWTRVMAAPSLHLLTEGLAEARKMIGWIGKSTADIERESEAEGRGGRAPRTAAPAAKRTWSEIFAGALGAKPGGRATVSTSIDVNEFATQQAIIEAQLDHTRVAATKTGHALSLLKQAQQAYAEDLKKIGASGFREIQQAHDVYGKSIEDLAVTYGVSESSIHRWLDQAKAAGKTAEEIAAGPMKKLGVRIIELNAQLAAAEKEGPAAMKVALAELDTELRDVDARAKMFGTTVQTNSPLGRGLVALGKLTRDTFHDISKDLEHLPGFAKPGSDPGIKEFERQQENANRRIDLERKIAEQVRGMQQDSLEKRLRDIDLERDKMVQSAHEQGDFTAETLGMIDALHRTAAQRITQEWIKAHKRAFDLSDTLSNLSNAFSQLAQIGGHGLDGLLGKISEMIGLMNVAAQAGAALAQVFRKKDAEGNVIPMGQSGSGFDLSAFQSGGKYTALSIGAGAAQAAPGIVSGIGALASATDVAGRGNRIGRGAVAGAALGGQLAGPYGALAGLVVGALVGALRNPAFEDVMKRVGRNLGVTISEELGRSIADRAKKEFKGSRQAAEIASTAQIIGEAGGLDEKNIERFSAQLRSTFSMIETHQMTIAQGTKVLDENWQAFVAAGTSANGRLSASLREIITLNDRFGTQSKEIASYVKEQTGLAQESFNAVMAAVPDVWHTIGAEIKAAQDDIDKLIKDRIAKVAAGEAFNEDLLVAAHKRLADAQGLQASEAARNKQELEDLGFVALATYGAMIERGHTHAEALRAAAPGLQLLREAYENLGLTVEDVGLKDLMIQQQMLAGAPQLINGVGALASAFIALDNAGQLNADTFARVQRIGTTMYTRLQAESAKYGGTAEEMTRRALLPMQDYLHEAAEQAKLLQVPLDENTQMLIDQSQALGIWKEKGKSDTQQMIDVMRELTGELKEFLSTLRGIPPKVDTTITTHYKTDGEPQLDEDGNPIHSTGQPLTTMPIQVAGLSSTAAAVANLPRMNTVPPGAPMDLRTSQAPANLTFGNITFHTSGDVDGPGLVDSFIDTLRMDPNRRGTIEVIVTGSNRADTYGTDH